MEQVRSFLLRYPPFSALRPDELDRVVRSIEIAFFPAGEVILRQAGEPATHLHVVRTGAVELLDGGRLVDLLGEGELFGHPSLLSGLGPIFDVRAHEDTICYLIPREEAERLLARPAGLAYLTASLERRARRMAEAEQAGAGEPRLRPVGELVRRAPVVVPPTATVREAADLMARERISSVLVGDGRPEAILTDRDLRARVVAAGLDPGTPVASVASRPLISVEEGEPVEEVLLRMLEHGIHHLAVVGRDGAVRGVVTDTDLLGLERVDAFAVRTAIERARGRDEVVAEARRIPEVVSALVDSDVDPVHVGRVVSLLVDACTRRLVELAEADLGDPPGPYAWLALGSQARREQALLTDQDHALAYRAEAAPPEEAERYFAELAARVVSGLEAAGVPRCRGGVMASEPAWRRTDEGWRRELRRWVDEPGLEGRVFASIALDYRRVAGSLDVEADFDAEIRRGARVPGFVRRVGQAAVELRPPTGFFRDLVVDAMGRREPRLDVKHLGIVPVTNLARAHAVAAGVARNDTLGRLRAARAAGRLSGEAASALEEAFRLLWQVRLDHQVLRARAGERPDDLVDPGALGPITRRALKQAFREIVRAQAALANLLGLRAW
ncbi:MAG TPA: DUF294 nucleotidyltransferase-like domain-containing protein [Actinomycetota bacterium]|nr:DUF294 nucleotidyltransferase-like domain-containing protein [Actinomycetota bacterium]